jgi:hypothetical protein
MIPELALQIAAAILPSFPFVGGSAGGRRLLSFARYTSSIEVSFGVSEEGAESPSFSFGSSRGWRELSFAEGSPGSEVSFEAAEEGTSFPSSFLGGSVKGWRVSFAGRGTGDDFSSGEQRKTELFRHLFVSLEAQTPKRKLFRPPFLSLEGQRQTGEYYLLTPVR